MIKAVPLPERIYSPFVLVSLLLYLVGLFFPVRVAQNMGFAGIVIAALLSVLAVSIERSRLAWGGACALMLVAGVWGAMVAPDPAESWRHFWSYQMIGKGAVCALALLILPLSSSQLRWVLAFLLALLVARNIQMAIYGFQNVEVVLGMPKSEAQLLGFRNHGDHIVLLAPFVMAITLSWRRWYLSAVLLLAVEVVLLAMTGWRGAWLGLFGGSLCVLVYFRAWKILGLLALLMLSVGVIGSFVLDGNIVGQALRRGVGDSQRVELVWKPVLNLIAASNWQGYGFGSARFMEVFSGYVAAHPEKGLIPFPDPHNMVLAFAMAAGWLGAMAFVVMLALGISLCVRHLRCNDRPEMQSLAAAAVASWVGVYGILGLTDQPYYNNLALLMALTSMVLACGRKRDA
ncbi:MAG: O-antigen ligase family protein [Dechloromonas agitata]|uniref:O-antigen ligase family protein n=1 Tax=Dechloromonas agitata TaxID=73030 RepID=A0A930BRE9_9RHOO|nr:O-antigen ligase family protein [Dechloromonas agitata]